MIVSEIINEARDVHECFEDERLPDTIVVRRLENIESTLLQKIVLVAEETLAHTIEFDAEDIADAEDGLPLPPHLLIYAPTIRREDGRNRTIGIVPEAQAGQFHKEHAQVFLRGNLLFLDGWWTGVTSLRVTYVPSAVPIESLDQELVLPDDARPAVVSQLALWMAGRRGVLKELPHLPEQAKDEMATLIQMMSERSSTTDWRVLQVR